MKSEAHTNKQYQVLLVEDNPGDVRLFQEYFRDIQGLMVSIEHRDTFKKALECLAERTFDLAFLDLSLSDRQGLEGVSEILRNYPSLPLIVLTGLDNEDLALEALRRGAQDYLVKNHVDSYILKRSLRHAVERKKIEEEIRFQKTLLECESEALSDGILIILSDGKVHSWNKRFLEFWGQPTPKIEGFKDVKSLFSALADRFEQPEEFISKAALIHEDSREEGYETILKDRRILEMTTAPIKSREGRHYGRVWYMRDITEQRHMENVKNDFISTVSHELRTPLAIVKGAIGNLKDGILGSLTDKQQKVIETTNRNVQRLSRLINDLLDLSRLESGKTTAKKSTVSINEIVQQTVQNFQERAKNLNLKVAEISDGDQVYVDGDMIVQVLNNLLDNALRYGRQNIQISIRPWAGFADPAWDQRKASTWSGDLPDEGTSFIQITVQDDGEGIESRYMPLLFNKFEQIHRLVGSGYKGTGLGLAICKEIIHLHDGLIWAESIQGEGTRFQILLPAYNEGSEFKSVARDMTREASRLGQKVAFLSFSISGLEGLDDEKRLQALKMFLDDVAQNALRRSDRILKYGSHYLVIIAPGLELDAAASLSARVKQGIGKSFSLLLKKEPLIHSEICLYPSDEDDFEKLKDRLIKV